MAQFQDFNPFIRDSSDLICISTNDVAPGEVKSALLSPFKNGEELVKKFVKDRLEQNAHVDFWAKVSRQKSKTFASLSNTKASARSPKMNKAKGVQELFK